MALKPGSFLTLNSASYTLLMRQALIEAGGLSENAAALWTTHVSRRGAAADILHRQGLQAMLQQGDWKSARGAHPYTPKDEIDEIQMGEVLIDSDL